MINLSNWYLYQTYIIIDPEFVKPSTPDVIITPHSNSKIHISSTNITNIPIVHLEPETKLNISPMLFAEEQHAILVFNFFLRCDNPVVNISPLHHRLTKYMHFYHIPAISNVSRSYQYTYRTSYIH